MRGDASSTGAYAPPAGTPPAGTPRPVGPRGRPGCVRSEGCGAAPSAGTPLRCVRPRPARPAARHERARVRGPRAPSPFRCAGARARPRGVVRDRVRRTPAPSDPRRTRGAAVAPPRALPASAGLARDASGPRSPSPRGAGRRGRRRPVVSAAGCRTRWSPGARTAPVDAPRAHARWGRAGWFAEGDRRPRHGVGRLHSPRASANHWH